MKSKIIKSMMGLACLLAVDATPATDEGLIEETVATCKDGNCGKSKYEGGYVGLGLDWTRNNNRLYVDKAFDIATNNVVLIGTTVGKKTKSSFGADLRFGWRYFPSGICFLLAEAGMRLGSNTKVDIDQKVAAHSTVHGPVSPYFKGKIDQKGFVPFIALGVGGYICPVDAIVYCKVLISHYKVECTYATKSGTNITQKISTPRVSFALGLEKKVWKKLGIYGEFRVDTQSRKKQISRSNYIPNPLLGQDIDATLYSKGVGFGLGVNYSF